MRRIASILTHVRRRPFASGAAAGLKGAAYMGSGDLAQKAQSALGVWVLGVGFVVRAARVVLCCLVLSSCQCMMAQGVGKTSR